MRVTSMGHAALLCETEDVRILMDPWLVGPANFRSWWHLPETNLDTDGLPRLDYLYISHLHGDHFHVPTLKLLDQRPTVLVPRLYHDRMVSLLRSLGYSRIQELSHGAEVRLGRSTRACCLQMGNDSLLAVADSSAAMLNANDCLQGNDPRITLTLLGRLGERYRFDIAFLAFGTAGPFPKCYRFEDPAESLDPWIKERAMLNGFVQGARASGARTVVPFAGGFALLADRLMWMNEVKTTPADAAQALRAKAPDLEVLEMNPGDIWDSRTGLVRVHQPVRWEERLAMIRAMHQKHAGELSHIDAEERQGPPNLYDLFESRITKSLWSFPFLRRRMNCPVLFDVEGRPGGQWEVDLRRSRGWFRDGDSGDWQIRVTIPSALLAEVLTDPDGWETLGISYKLDLYLKKRARAKEALLTRLVGTPSPLSLIRLLLAPRFAEFVVRRKDEFLGMVRQKLLAE
jgi:hypothetical protein